MIERNCDTIREDRENVIRAERNARAWVAVRNEDIPVLIASNPQFAPDAMAWIRARGTREQFAALASLSSTTLYQLFSALMDYDDTTYALREWWCETQFEG